MALQHKITDQYGQTLNAAYTRAFVVNQKEWIKTQERVAPLYQEIYDEETGEKIDVKTIREEVPEAWEYKRVSKIHTETWVSKEVAGNQSFHPLASAVEKTVILWDNDSELTVEQAYTELKSLDKYKDAVDS